MRGNCTIFVGHGFSRAEEYAVSMRLYRPRKKSVILSSRAQRGICFFTNARNKADSSGKPRPRNDSFGVFPQPPQVRHSGTRKTRALAHGALPNLDGLLIMRWVPVSDGGPLEDFDSFNCAQDRSG